MKLFGKKKNSEKTVRRVSAAPTHTDFYHQPSGDAPLHEYSGAAGPVMRRTSRHTPSRPEGGGNRTSDWAISMLLLRAFLILIVLGGGFFGLKWWLGTFEEPSKKEQKQWEVNAAVMDKDLATDSFGSMDSSAAQGTPDLLPPALKRWALAERHLRSAETLEQRGLDEEAAQRLRQVLAVVPDNRGAQQMLLDIYLQQAAFEDAIPLAVSLLNQDSTDWTTQLKLLQALQECGRPEDCLLLTDRMLNVQPNNMMILGVSAWAHVATEHPDEALAIFERMLDNNPRHEGALGGAAAIHRARGEWRLAIPYYLELVRMTPESDTYRALAECYAQLGEEGKTVILLGQAASLYGEKEVAAWLRDAGFDPVRETSDFRSFTDQTVGIETRRAIEALRRREAEQPSGITTEFTLPEQPSLKIRPDDLNQ